MSELSSPMRTLALALLEEYAGRLPAAVVIRALQNAREAVAWFPGMPEECGLVRTIACEEIAARLHAATGMGTLVEPA